MLLPHDVRTKLTLSDDSDVEVQGIPDRTFQALLELISKKKGDNIVSQCPPSHCAMLTELVY